MNGDARQQNI